METTLTSIQRYSDSTDMLTWLGNGDNENNLDRHYRDRRLNRTGDRHVDKSYNTTMVSDSHYHSCEDETANQSLALKQLPRNDDNNQEFDDAGWIGSWLLCEVFTWLLRDSVVKSAQF